MDLLKTVDHMSQDMYLRLKSAAETGKWPEGTAVDKAQRETALQLTMAYQARHLDNDQMLTIGADGQIVEKTKRDLKSEFSGESKEKELTPCAKPVNPEDEVYMPDDKNIAHFTEL